MKRFSHLSEYLLTLSRGRPLRRAEDAYSPIFIVGSGRSGTTLLRSIMCAHPDIHIPPETYVLRSLIREYRRYRRLPWEILLRLLLSKFEYNTHFSVFDVSLRPLYNDLLNIPYERQTLAFVLHSFYLYHCAQVKPTASRWGDKTPLNTFALNSIYSVFPDAYFVHLVRDGRDVVASYLQMRRYQTAEEAADRWLLSIHAVREFERKHPDSILQIHYEQLVRRTEETTRRICDFVSIDYRPAMTASSRLGTNEMVDVERLSHLQNVKRPINAESIGRWRNSLTNSQAETLENLLGPDLKQMGYDI